MRILSTLTIISIAFNSFGQFSSTPCTSGSLPTACAANTVNLTSSMSNSGVTNPATENGSGCSSVGSDVTAGTIYDYDGWFTTTADASGVVDVYAAIISGDPVIGLYSGPCSSPTLLSCDDDGGAGLDAYINQTGLTPGGTYYVRIWDYNGGTGTYEVTTNGGTPPSNDDCSAATGLTLNGSPIGGTNYCATVETSDWDDCESNTENNVWYSFTTTVDGDITVNFTAVDCFGSGAGVDVSVFYGNCTSFSSYGCTAVASSGSGSISTFTGPAGTYYVMVDGDNSGGATSLCDFDIDVDFVGCTADAGTNTSPAIINNCAGGDVTTASATGTVNTYLGTDPCIGWGFWVADDPLGVFTGLSGIGNLPTGNNPAGTNPSGNNGDPNYVGVWPSDTYPLANGENPIFPDEANGVTYYIAPITLSNCQTGEISTACFDIGNVTQVYYNPEITYASVIDCDVAATPTTQVSIAIGGGLPSVDGSNFSLSNTGDGTLSSTSVADGGTVTVTGIPDGGTVSITVTDGVGCTETITIGPIDATAYCPFCGVDAGTYSSELNSTVTTSPVVMCYGDILDLLHNGDYTLPSDLNICGDPPGPSTFNGSTTGSCNPGIVYGIFSDFATTANPFDDATFSGFGFSGEDQSFTNDGSLIAALLAYGIPIVDNTFYLYPVTADITGIDMNGDGNPNWSEDYDGDECVDSGTPIAITMLNQLQANVSDGCAGPQITITGGYPEFFPGNYTITNNGSGTVGGTPVTHGETITIYDLNDGDAYDITITDGNGCSINVTGTYNFTEPTLSINGLATDFCVGDAADAFTTSPSPVTVTSGTFDIDVTSDGFSSELSFEVFDASGTSVWTYDLTTDYTAGTNAPTITTSSLTAGDGPFTLVISDSYGDGESFDPSGQTVITNNVTGAVVGTTSGNWGSSITINLYDFYSFTSTLTGTGVTDNGDGTGSFNPNTVGTHDVVFTYSSTEGCDYYDTLQVTVHQVPLLGSTIDPSICAGETLLLSDYSPGEANGVAGTGTWYTDAGFTTAASTSAFTPTNGQQFYYQYVTTAGSCTDDASITVTVNPNPTASAGSDVVIDCNSTSGQEALDGSGSSAGMTYAWSTSTGNIVSGGSTTTPIVDAAGTYTITVTNTTTGCSATDDVVVTEDLTPPTANAGSDVVIDCNSTGGQESLDGSGSTTGMTYAWSTGTGNIVSGGSTTTPTVDAAGTYTITVTNASNGCSATDDVVVTEDLTPPTANAGSDVVIDCNSTGGQESLDGSGSTTGMTYAWSTGTGNIVSGGSTTTPTVDAAGTYTITVTNTSNGCSATDDVVVTEDLTPPTADAGSDVVIDCNSAGGQESLDGSGSTTGMTYAWSTGTGNIVSGGSTTTPTVDAAGTYTITVTNTSNGCSATDDVVVTEDLTAPTADAGSDVVIDCNSAGGQETLDGSGSTTGMTYAWSTGTGNIVSGGSTTTPTVDAAGTYTITVTDASNGCSATDDVVVTEDANIPTANAGTDVIIDCNSTSGQESLDGSGSTTGMTYAWSTGTGNIVSGGSTTTPTVDAAGTYTITVTNTSNGCSATDDVVVTEDLTAPTADAGADVVIDCNSTSGQETLDGSASTTGMTYSWSTAGAGNIVSGGSTTTPTVDAAGTYTITVTNTSNGCSATDDVVVTEDLAVPTADAGADVTTTCTTPTATLSGSASGGSSPYSYSWDNSIGAVQNPTVDPATTTTYTLTVTGANGCTDTDDVTVTVDETLPTIDPVSDDSGCNGDMLGGYSFTGTPASGVTYSWANSNTSIGLSGSGSGNISAFAATNPGSSPITGTITITAEITASGCQATSTFDITVNPVPVLAATTDPEVCANANSINLSSYTPAVTNGVAGSGQWYTGTDNTGTPVSGTQAGLSDGDQFYYEFTATVGSCTAGAMITVTVNPVPVLSAVSNPSVCADANSIDLSALTPSETAGVAGSGQWYTGTNNTGTPVSGVQTVSNGDQFFYEYTSSVGSCTDDVTISVTVNPMPVLSNVSNPSVCADANSIDLSTLTPTETAGVPGSGQWYTGTDNTGTPVSGVQSGLSDGDQFYYEYTSTAGGCADGHLLTVTVNALPVLSAVTDPDVCADANTIDLTSLTPTETAGVAGSGQWYAGTSNTDPAVSGVQTVNDGDQFYYEYTSSTGSCTDDLTITVTVNPLPTATNQSAAGVCEDTQGSGTVSGIDLTSYESSINGGAGITYNWYADAGLTTSVGTPSSVTVSNGDIYYAQVVDGTTGCSDVAQVDFTVYSIPTTNDITPSICEDVLGSGQTSGVNLTGNNSSINSGGGITFTWYTDAGLTSPVASPSNTTVNNNDVFYVEVDNGNCTDVATVTYSVTSTITLTDPNPQLCEDVLGGGTYAGYDLTSINGSVYSGSGSTIYTWYQSDMTTAVGTPTNVTLSDGDQYYVDVADGNCSNAIMVNFNVNSLPTVTAVSDIEQCDEGSSMATFDLTSVQSGVNATGPTYNWFSDSGLTTGIGTPGSYSSTSSTVYVQVVDANGCQNDIGVNLVVNPLPTATATSLEECNTGSNQATFDLTSVESTVDGGVGNTVNWYSDAILATPISTPSAYQTVSTTVYAEVTDGNSCSNSVGVTLTVNPLPTATDQTPAGICEDTPGGGTATIDLTSYESGINGGAGFTINWFSDAGLTTSVATPSAEAASNGSIYYAQVIDNTTLCENTAEVTITVFSAPSAADITPSLCEDVLGSGQTSGVDLTSNNVSINNNAGLTFTWYTDAALTTAVSSPTSTTINNGDQFFVEVSNGNCTSVAQVDYTVTSTITLNDPAPEMCESSQGSLQFTGYDLTSLNTSVYAGGGGTTYTWYESDMVTAVAGANNIILNNNDQYYLEVIDGNCSNTIMITFTVNPLPTATDQTPAGICEDTPGSGIATVDLTSYESSINGGAGITINWFSDAGLTTPVTTPTAEGATDGNTYYAQVIDNTTLCEDTAQLTITVFSAPSATDITPSTCEDVLGSSQASGIDLTANNGNINGGTGLTFTWYTDAALTTAESSPTSATVNNGDIFYVEVSNGNCTSVAQVDYAVTSTISLTDPLPEMCETTEGSLQTTGYDLTSINSSVYSGSGSTIYTWYESDMVTTVSTPTSVDVNNGDQYYIEVADGNCSNAIMITFTVNPIPSMTPVTALELCDDGTGQATFDLTAEEGNINATGPTYNWYSDAGLTTVISTPSAYSTTTTTAYLEVTDANGCSNSYGLDVTVNPLPSANTTSSDICDDGTGQATFDLTSMESTVDGGAGNTINWFSDAGLTTTIGAPTAYTTTTTTVYAEVTDATTGCTNSTAVDLNVTASPSAPILSSNSSYCEGENISDLTANGGGGTITWYDDASLSNVVGTGTTFTPTLSGTGNTTYYVVEDLGGCISEVDSVTVTINPNPVADFTASTTNGNIPLDVDFTDASTGNGLSYSWEFGDDNTSNQQNPSNTFDELGSFTTILTVTDNNGCSDTTSTVITVAGESVLIIPNIFSPNGDGSNDIWNVEGTNITEIQGTIMNRWGQVMFQFDVLELGWDGRTVSGVEASEGTYYYIIDAVGQDGTVYNYQGPFELVR